MVLFHNGLALLSLGEFSFSVIGDLNVHVTLMLALLSAQEFYAVAVEELIFTTISGVAAVTGVGFFFFPHWMAVFFTFPLIAMLYIDLLGEFPLA